MHGNLSCELLGLGCSKAVEPTPENQEVMG